MPRDPHRVTTDHIAFLAAGPTRADGSHGTTLADTDEGIRLVDPGQILAPGSGVRRMLLTRTDLLEAAAMTDLSLSAYVKQHAGQIAAGLNALLTEAGRQWLDENEGEAR